MSPYRAQNSLNFHAKPLPIDLNSVLYKTIGAFKEKDASNLHVNTPGMNNNRSLGIPGFQLNSFPQVLQLRNSDMSFHLLKEKLYAVRCII
jgi:hypothetical protein